MMPRRALLLPLLILTSAWAQESYDLILSNGRIVDGTGNPWFRGDLAIRADRIVRIAPAGALKNAAARQRIDVQGMVVAPGFIDIQSHSRGALLRGDGRVLSKVTQGVTTEIMGEGWTDAPANEKTAQSEASAGRTSNEVPPFTGPRAFDKWLRAMEQHGGSVNFGSFLGATTVRMYVKGMAPGEPSAAEVEQMRGLVKSAMEDGAFGVATALIYPPGEYATTAELVEMAKEMAPYGGVYITHMRSEGDQLLEGIEEAITIGRKGGVPVEIYHLKAGGKRNWGKGDAAIARIDQARREGVDITACMYSYVAGGTGLTAVLPPWASANGKLFDNLADPAARAKMKDEIQSERTNWENMGQLATPEGVLIVGLRNPENKKYVGKRLSEIATMMGKNWMDAAMDLILADRTRVETLYFMMNEGNVRKNLQQPWIKLGSDAGGLNPETARDLAHPRAYGNFARVLGRYVRDEQVLSLEDAVRKMSSAVARRLSIRDRGLLQEGMLADVVVFDPETIADKATFEQPHQLSVGVRHVFVNGVQVLKDGQHTGAKPGRIVRGPGYVQQ